MKEPSSFVLVFGTSPLVRVTDFLIENREFDYSLTDIAKGAGIGWTTIYQIWPTLVRLNMVRKTRKVGRAVLFKLNLENPLVKKLIELDILVSKQMIMKAVGRQKIAA